MTLAVYYTDIYTLRFPAGTCFLGLYKVFVRANDIYRSAVCEITGFEARFLIRIVYHYFNASKIDVFPFLSYILVPMQLLEL